MIESRRQILESFTHEDDSESEAEASPTRPESPTSAAEAPSSPKKITEDLGDEVVAIHPEASEVAHVPPSATVDLPTEELDALPAASAANDLTVVEINESLEEALDVAAQTPVVAPAEPSGPQSPEIDAPSVAGSPPKRTKSGKRWGFLLFSKRRNMWQSATKVQPAQPESAAPPHLSATVEPRGGRRRSTKLHSCRQITVAPAESSPAR